MKFKWTVISEYKNQALWLTVTKNIKKVIKNCRKSGGFLLPKVLKTASDLFYGLLEIPFRQKSPAYRLHFDTITKSLLCTVHIQRLDKVNISKKAKNISNTPYGNSSNFKSATSLLLISWWLLLSRLGASFVIKDFILSTSRKKLLTLFFFCPRPHCVTKKKKVLKKMQKDPNISSIEPPVAPKWWSQGVSGAVELKSGVHFDLRQLLVCETGSEMTTFFFEKNWFWWNVQIHARKVAETQWFCLKRICNAKWSHNLLAQSTLSLRNMKNINSENMDFLFYFQFSQSHNMTTNRYGDPK